MGFFDLFKRKDKQKNKKYKMGLHKTREGALSTLKDILSRSSKIDDDLFLYFNKKSEKIGELSDNCENNYAIVVLQNIIERGQQDEKSK